MNKSYAFAFLTIITLIFSSTYLYAQDYVDTTKVNKNSPSVNIKLKDGTRFKGKIIKNDGKNYLIQTDNLGTLNIPAENIVSTEQISAQQILLENSQPAEPLRNTDYFVSSNGYNLKEGEWRYSNTYFYYNTFGVGLTDNFSMNLGIIPIANIFAFSGKFAFEASDKVHIALNGSYITSASNLINISAGALGGVATFGTNSKNISIGATWGIGNGGNFTNKPLIQLSGITQISRKVSLTMDNFLTTDTRINYNSSGSSYTTSNVVVGILTYGVRLLWTRSLLDLGLVSTLNRSNNYFVPAGIPYFKFTTSLSKKR